MCKFAFAAVTVDRLIAWKNTTSKTLDLASAILEIMNTIIANIGVNTALDTDQISDKKTGMGNLFNSKPLIVILVPVVVMLLSTILFAIFIDHIVFRDLTNNVRKVSVQKAHGAGQIIRMLPVDFSKSLRQDDVTGGSLNALQNQIGILSQYYEARVTVVADDGVVLADSDMSTYQLKTAQNHAKRPEIMQAQSSGQGFGRRHSSTLDIEFLYTAIPLKLNGKAITVRIATPLNEVFAQRKEIRELLALGVLSSILIVVFFAIIFGKKLSNSIKVDRDRLEASVIERTAALSTLQELGSMLAMCHNLEEAGNVIGAQLPILIPDSCGALALMNNSRDLMVVDHEWGGVWSKGEFYPPDTCWSLRKNEVHVSGNGQLACQHLTADAADSICIPLMAQGETLGIIHLRGNAQKSLPEKSLAMAHSIGKEVAVAISNLKLRQSLEQQALHDPLTGLYNRRHLMDQFSNISAKANQKDQPFCLLIVDVDHFKKYNDQYGHDAGDYVLTQLAKQFRKSLGTSDIACRMGGEEFAIILANSDVDQADEFANRLRSDIENLNLIFQGRPLGEITISIGLSSYPDEGTTLQGLIKSADELLYVAKNSGRNRVCKAQAA